MPSLETEWEIKERARRVERALDLEMARLKAASEIHCPECNYEFDYEDMDAHVTYHGEDGPKDTECPSCDCKLTIDEDVTRTWEVTVKEEDNPERKRLGDQLTKLNKEFHEDLKHRETGLPKEVKEDGG